MKWYENSLFEAVNTLEWLALINDIQKYILTRKQKLNLFGMSEEEICLLIATFSNSMAPGKSQRTKLEGIIQNFSPNQDENIMLECRKFLNSNVSMSSIEDSVGCLYAINYLLKFYQKTVSKSDCVEPNFIRIVSILVLVMKDYLSKNRPPNVETIIVLTQEFFALLTILPSFIIQLPTVWSTHQSLQKLMECEMSVINGVPKLTDNKSIEFSKRVLKRIQCIDGNIADAIVKQVLFIKNIDVISNLMQEDDIHSEIFDEFIKPIVESVFIGYLSQATLLYIWDQIMLCIAGAEPIETSLLYILSCFMAIFLFLCWIRIPNVSMSNSKYTNEMKETEEDKTVTSNNVNSLHEQFLIIGPKLQKDDFQFLIKKYFFMDIFCLLTGTQQYNTNGSMLSSDQLLTSLEWSSILQKSYLIDPSKRKEQRLLRYAELEKLRNTEDQLVKMQQQLETYKSRLKEASDEISHSKQLISQYATQENYMPNKFNEFNDSTVHDKEKWTPNLHRIKLLKNVAHNFLHKSVQDLNSVKYSHAIQTEDN
ncbi:hypothetical protein EWB00_002765 [Schistosoma japonicum]|uniref:Uncharacterized protein n=1 Tax=Schistosoma japonicum TaxID=6182 RepID=A0A4Z2DB40_SCHJA|nr:hypothetical protein EWB00_002765 [Schistosoma japonicum]